MSVERYVAAGRIAYLAMTPEMDRRRGDSRHPAVADPLAWWCLTEAIHDLGDRVDSAPLSRNSPEAPPAASSKPLKRNG